MAIVVAAALLGAAVVRELRLPPDHRTWHGVLFGWIPYDLRLPTPRRLADTLWQPGNAHILVPTAFGVGWTPNLAAIMRGVE